MNRSSIMVALLLSTASLSACREDDSPSAGAICAVKAHQVCEVPFEILYSHRESLLNRVVRLDGVLVVGARPEPLVTDAPVVLLFPSAERAEFCNQKFAVEVIVQDKGLLIELYRSGGAAVSIAGRLRPSTNGHLAEIEVAKAPSLLTGVDRMTGDCMRSPPPLLPDSR